jgi:tRNA 2-thiouridine synthesizing protein A
MEIDPNTLTVGKTVDGRGHVCPIPIAMAKIGLKRIADGEILELLSDDDTTLRDLPAMCNATNREYLGHKTEDGYKRYFVKK